MDYNTINSQTVKNAQVIINYKDTLKNKENQPNAILFHVRCQIVL